MGINNLDIIKAKYFLNRVLLCANLIKSDSLLILEDDVLVKNKLYGNIKENMAGPYFGNEFNPLTIDSFNKYKLLNYSRYYGGSGGTIFNWKSMAPLVISRYNEIIEFIEYSFTLEVDQQKCIDYIWSLINAFLGFNYQKLDCLDEILRNPNCINNPKISIIHQYKQWQ